jgi:hypothetical protein
MLNINIIIKIKYMILIFDTFSGLCNQFYDINCGINFCLINNIKFSFRYCSFRENNLVNWYNQPFEKLFNLENLKKNFSFSNLYVDYETLCLTNENTYNLIGEVAIKLFTDNFLDEIININKEFIVLKQFWSIYKFKKIIINMNIHIIPSNRLMDIYNRLKPNIIHNNEPYNFLHYRYEHDFTNHFNLQIEDLKTIILRVRNNYKNPNLKIYIATNNIKNLININDPELPDIIFKNDDEINDYNYEEKAFIDYMFGLNSVEVYGHNNSSFSHMLNNLKNTNNYYA